MKYNDNVDRRAKKLHDAYQQEINGVQPANRLHPENIDGLIGEKSPEINGKEKRSKRKISFYKVTAIAASLALVLGIGAAALHSIGNQQLSELWNNYPRVRQTEDEENAQESAQPALGTVAQQYSVAADDYTPLAEYLKAAKKQYEKNNGKKHRFTFLGFGGTKATQDEVLSSTAEAASSDAPDFSEYSSTNNQVENVDEGDIVKTDGKYIYSLTAYGSLVCSRIEADGSLTKTGSLAISALDVVKNSSHFCCREMYLCEGTLALVISCAAEEEGNETTAVVLIDTADGKLSVSGSYVQEGVYQSGRMTDCALYVVSSEQKFNFVSLDNFKNPEEYVTSIWKNGEKELLSTEELCIACEDADSMAYTNITGYRFGDPVKEVQTLSILGENSSELYCTKDTLYLFDTQYHWGETVNDGFTASVSLEDTTTTINSFSLDGGKIAVKAKGSVSGRMLNQFSADEKDGYLRIATTDEAAEKRASRMTVLDGDLKVVSELTGIAPDEEIYSCRFMGDKAYLVTFYQTDPLFVIDLSDVAAPKITGELKLPGFSNYLYPAGENYLIGVGKNADEEGRVDGMRINLFDVSDPENPKLADYKTLSGDSASLAAETHKAFYYDAKNNCFGVPIYRYLGGREQFNGFVVFDLENGKLDVKEEIDLKAQKTELDWNKYTYWEYFYSCYCVLRGVYVGDTLYLLSGKQIYSYQRDTLAYLNCFDLD